MRLSWRDLGTPRADKAHGKIVEISGWPTTPLSLKRADYFLVTAEPGCCAGCVPRNPLAVIEVFASGDIDLAGGPLRLSGTLHIVTDDPDQWRYQLRVARPLGGVSRRSLLAASPLLCLPVSAIAQTLDGTAVDIHSHAGNLTAMSYGRGSFAPVAEPMRQGSVSVICLAIVADSPTIRVIDGRLRPGRDPNPFEFVNFSKRAFEALHALVREQGMPIIRTAADLRAARATRPSVIVSSEGADFLEGRIERLDEAYQRWQLRHCSSPIIASTSLATSRPSRPRRAV
jgi:membrane dipeptidase